MTFLPPKWRAVWLGLWLFGALGAARAHALDPAKALTQYGHDHWTSNRGLPVTAVEVLSRTADGYLWIGTEEGLVRFDGVRFTVFDQYNTPGLANHNVRALYPRRQGGLWVGTWRGLFRFERGRATAVPVIPEDPKVVMEALYEAPDGTLWVGTQGYGAVRLDPSGRRPAVRYGTREGLPHDVVWSLAGDRDGSLWIGTHTGLARLRQGKVETFEDQLVQCSVGGFFPGPDGSWWIATGAGLAHYRNGRFRLYTQADGLLGAAVDAIWVEPRGTVWIGTRSGLSRFEPDRPGPAALSHFRVEDGLADRIVRALWMDPEGSLWIGTRGGGLERLRDGKFTLYGKPEGLADSVVNTMVQDREGAVWFGTRRGLTRRGPDGTMTSWGEKQGLVSDFVTTLLLARDGTLWVGTAAGMSRSVRGPGGDIERFEIFRKEDPWLYTFISSLHEDAAGGIWISSSYLGLARWADGRLRTFTAEDGLAPAPIAVILGSRDGGLWLGAEGGLLRYRDGVFTRVALADGKAEEVYSLYEEADGTLWIGTFGSGLQRLRGNRVQAVTAQQGLYDNVILQILEDGQGSFWLASNRGIARVSKAEIGEVLAGRRPKVACTVFDTADGLRSRSAMAGDFPNALRDRDGHLWFATDGGAVEVDPRRLPANRLAPPVEIEGLAVDGRPAATSTLPPGSNRLELAYTALTFLAPERVRFKVRLAGFDRTWVEMGNRRTASYTNLPPGPYTFEVLAANADGVWSRRPAKLSFSLAPRFYQTAWFQILVVAFVLLAGWLLYRVRTRALAARYQAVVGERTRIARELHDTLAQGLAGVALQLEAAASEGAPPPVRSGLERARSLVRETLAAARRSVWNLRAAELEDRDLREALDELARTLTSGQGPKIAVRCSGVARPLPERVEENLFRISQEAITNALKHARAESIRVELAFEERQVRLSVEDDGTGFASRRNDPGEPHFGLMVMKERAEALAGRLAVLTRDGQGTAVTVEVPLAVRA